MHRAQSNHKQFVFKSVTLFLSLLVSFLFLCKYNVQTKANAWSFDAVADIFDRFDAVHLIQILHIGRNAMIFQSNAKFEIISHRNWSWSFLSDLIQQKTFPSWLQPKNNTWFSSSSIIQQFSRVILSQKKLQKYTPNDRYNQQWTTLNIISNIQ